MPPAFFQYLFVGCFLIGLLFLVRLLCAPFSATIRLQMRQQRVFHWVWGCFALFASFLLFVLFNPEAWPPAWWERRTQRERILQRVQSAGGWEALRRDCILLAQTNEIIQWSRWHTNDAPVLPPAIATLQPQQVYFFPPKLLGPQSNEPRTPVVRIKIFGMHSTGGHSTPYFGLEIVAASSNEDYTPKARPAVSGNGHRNYRKVSEGIYEIF